MAAGDTQITITGNLVEDPELRGSATTPRVNGRTGTAEGRGGDSDEPPF